MTGLIPGERWEHGFGDFLAGLAAGMARDAKPGKISLPGIGGCLPVRSGRAALIVAIRALNLPEGAGIGVPLYCCPVVFKAIAAAGCKNVFIDIDPSTFCMSASDLLAKRDRTAAVLAVHMFGNMSAMAALTEAAPGKPIIEDCAQSLGSRLDGRPAGTFGSISFFSFRSGKYISAGEGGALFSKDEKTLAALSKLVSALPAAGGAEELVHVTKTCIRSMLRSKPLYGMIGHRLWAAYNRMVDDTGKSPIEPGEIYRADLAIATKRLAAIDRMIAAQRANADYYDRALALDPEMLCTEKPGAFYNRYLYPVTFRTREERDFMADHLLRHQIAAIRPYHDIAETAAARYGYAGDCPRAERAAQRLLAIPCYYALTAKDREHIAGSVNEGWSEIRAK